MTALTYAGVLMPVLLQDGAGNAQTRVGVQVLNVDGTAASVYSDADRTPVTGQVASDGHGNVSGYFAEPGQVFRLVFHVEAQPVEVLTFSGIDVREIAAVKDTATAALVKSLNLADLTSASAARTNLGLGSAATQPTSAFDPAGAATAAQSAAISAASTDATSKVAAEATARASAITSAVSTLLNGAGPAYDTLKELQDLLTADESTATALAATVAARRAYVVHGATASTARPSSSGPVDWIGSVAPTNAIAGDEWRDTTTDPYTLKVKGTSGFGALGGTSSASTLTPTATKTASYTAAVGEIALMNVAGGGTVLNLPAAPADKAQVGYRAIGATTAVPLVINRGGSDTIGTAGATSASIPLADEVTILQYQASATRWLAVANVKTQASLDARYVIGWEPEVILRSGVAVVANNVVAPGIRCPRAVTVSLIVVRVGTAPTGSGLTVRINKNGVSWQTITVAATSLTTSVTPAAALALGDVLTFDVTAVGSTVAGADVACALVAA